MGEESQEQDGEGSPWCKSTSVSPGTRTKWRVAVGSVQPKPAQGRVGTGRCCNNTHVYTPTVCTNNWNRAAASGSLHIQVPATSKTEISAGCWHLDVQAQLLGVIHLVHIYSHQWTSILSSKSRKQNETTGALSD